MNWLIFLALLLPTAQDAQIPPIGIIDFYGLRTVTEQQARAALQIKEGDSLSDEPKEARARLEALPNVTQARLNMVCCDAGKAILFVGISESGIPSARFHPAPRGKVRLSQGIIKAGEEFERALMNAVLKGNSGEDDSHGHSLADDPITRAVEQRFITFAARDLKLLRDVLHHSADAEQRALAAQVMAYAVNKQSVANDLVEAMRDPAEGVRNNAMRALAVMAAMKSGKGIRISAEPFIDMLNSVDWTDRNKSSWVLQRLTEKHDPKILSGLRRRAVPFLTEMARWKSSGHAYSSFVLLGRVADLPEDQINAAWERGERTSFIEEAVKRTNAQ